MKNACALTRILELRGLFERYYTQEERLRHPLQVALDFDIHPTATSPKQPGEKRLTYLGFIFVSDQLRLGSDRQRGTLA